MTEATTQQGQAVAGTAPIRGQVLPMPAADKELWDSVMAQGFTAYPKRQIEFR